MSAGQPFAARDYYSDPRRRARSTVVRLASRVVRPLGIDVELRHFYSPIPQIDALPQGFWTTASDMPGVRVPDVDTQLDFLERELGPALGEFRPPRRATGRPYEYALDNGLFQGVDADVLYGMVRHFKPRRVIELGAGFSTLVTAMACTRNIAEGDATSFVTCDPWALVPPSGAVPGLAELRPVAAEDVPMAEFEALAENDVLFIDSSHTVRVGGDVNHLLLEVMPRLRSGVLVHLHDIFLPWHYPRDWIAHNRWYWAEQYLLQALLAGSNHWEVLFAAHAVARREPERLAGVVANFDPSAPPLSFWLRRTSTGTPD